MAIKASKRSRHEQGRSSNAEENGSACVAAFAAMAVPLAAQAKTFYWISHGGPADPVWTYFLAGAKQWAEGHRQHRQHLVPQRRRAVAAGSGPRRDRRQGRRHRHHQPRSGQPGRGRQGGATRPSIPIINFNTPDPTASFDAYVGGDNVVVGRRWAQYLVDKGLVKQGDFVWMPVEVPGATYGVAGGRRASQASSSRSASPGRSPRPRSTRPRSSPA